MIAPVRAGLGIELRAGEILSSWHFALFWISAFTAVGPGYALFANMAMIFRTTLGMPSGESPRSLVPSPLFPPLTLSLSLSLSPLFSLTRGGRDLGHFGQPHHHTDRAAANGIHRRQVEHVETKVVRKRKQIHVSLVSLPSGGDAADCGFCGGLRRVPEPPSHHHSDLHLWRVQRSHSSAIERALRSNQLLCSLRTDPDVNGIERAHLSESDALASER